MSFEQTADWWRSPAPTNDGRTNAELTGKELAAIYDEDTSRNAGKRWHKKRALGIKKFPNVHFPNLPTGGAAVKLAPPPDINHLQFLSRGRTLAEIEAEGFSPDDVRNLEGYDLFETRNTNYELTYLLLPKLRPGAKVKPREWTFRWATDTNGDPQPYIMVQLPDFKGFDKVKVVPLADVHWGSSSALEEKFREYVNWVEENDNIFVIINGDLFENSLGDSNRGQSFLEQSVRPRTQLEQMRDLLAPIAHKILWMHPGNHEDRSRTRDYDPLERLCEQLDVPYSYEPVYADILWRGNVFSVHAKHGNTNSQTKGGKMNAAMRPQSFQDFTMFTIMSHVHDGDVSRNTRICRDRVNFRLDFRKQYTVITPSFYGYFGSYASKAGYNPGSYGSINMDLFANGDYHANS